MSTTTKGFLSDDKWYEDLGHIALEFFFPGLGWVREFTTIRMGKLKIGQWPPSSGVDPVAYLDVLHPIEALEETHCQIGEPGTIFTKPYFAERRVVDLGRDCFGYALGDILRTIILVMWGSGLF